MENKNYTVEDYCKVIARNILSGNNSCGTLQSAVAAGDTKYFVKAAESVVRVLVQERDEAIIAARRGGAESNDDRRALEFIAQNLGASVHITNPEIIAQLESRLGRRIQ